MKRRTLPVKIFVLILVSALSLSGCWNRRELDTLSIVSGVALDKGEQTDQIKVTVQVIKPSEIKTTTSKGGGGGAGGPAPYFDLTETGTNVFETVRRMLDTSSRRLFWPHNQIIVISQDLARGGVRKYLDFFIRDHETRLMVFLLVSKGQAADILTETTDLEKIPSMEMAKIIKDIGTTSFAPQITLKKFTERLLSKTTAPVAPIVYLTNKEGHVAGTAVFKQDKLVGELNPMETRGLLWVTGEVKGGAIDVESLSGIGKNSLEIIRADKKITPEITDDKITITVKVREEGSLDSEMGSEDLTKLPAWAALEEKQAAAIENEIRAALEKAQELNTDIFGFGEAIHHKYPKQWKEIEPMWDEIFPTLEINVTVDAKLRRSGKTTKPPYPEEEK